jgi:hypothetical protein
MGSMTTNYSIVKHMTSVVDTVPIVMSKARMSIELIVEGLGRQEEEGHVMSIVCRVLCAVCCVMCAVCCVLCAVCPNT